MSCASNADFRGEPCGDLRVAHGLEAAAYRVRWKLAADHTLTARPISSAARRWQKQLGFGRRRAEAEITGAGKAGPAAAGGYGIAHELSRFGGSEVGKHWGRVPARLYRIVKSIFSVAVPRSSDAAGRVSRK